MSDIGVTKRIWLHLLKEGGRWSAAEIAEELCAQKKPVIRVLDSMASCESVKKFGKDDGAERVKFGITPSCRIANGVTVADILACDLVPFIGEEAKS